MTEIIFIVEDDVEGGLTARALGFPIFTQGDDADELKANILDAMRCHFDDAKEIPAIIRLHYVREEILRYA